MKLFAKAAIAVLVVTCQLSLVNASVIDEISVDSVNTVFALSPAPGVLTSTQNGVELVVERSDNTQQTISNVDFSLVTYLSSDNSSAGQAIADFTGGTITITNISGTLLTADIGSFSVEETINLPFSLLAGAGDFTVTGGQLASEFGPNGIIIDIIWQLSTDISDFSSQGFSAESDITLTPEPATMSLLAMGAIFAIKRRRRG
ncbi:MAG: PEP-CTERM sorting domain-containing protein [bacterium]|nr:PEP-CTERM sorting domain-containing protein [bacterium]